MGTSIDTWTQRVQAAREELLALPPLIGCHPDEELRALTRCHLELTLRSNNNQIALPIEDTHDRTAVKNIYSLYRADLLMRTSLTAKVFLHSARIVAGRHAVAPQLAFLAEVCTVQSKGQVAWWCRSASGSFSYRAGPAATHIQTDLRAPNHDHAARIFSETPLLSAAAFQEDVARIANHGAQLAIGHGKPSYILSSILRQLAEVKLLRGGFEPSCVSSLQVEHLQQNQAVIQVATTWLGIFTMQVTRTEFGECKIQRV
jgi:hypothetical protein